ncbi:MAG: substrate-binding domain-containing protein [Chitinivibrionales bacterium]|nr:substrate-binding domain-containing protein [Chitinivibrionales bacterium]
MKNIKDVARRAGVAISTVSHVINNTKYVSDELKTKVQEAIRELDYEVDPVARGLKSKKTRTIGVVITGINRVFFPQVIKGIQDATAAAGYHMMLYDTGDSFDDERRALRMLESQWVDGIILDSVAERGDTEYLEGLVALGSSKKRIPVVSLERDLSAAGIGSVVVDNRQGGRLAAEHLLAYGCTTVAMIAGPRNSPMAREREAGLRERLRAKGIALDGTAVLEGDFSPVSGYTAMEKVFASGLKPDGIFAANDQMAVGVIKSVKEHGLRIPGDIKVVGFDNTFVSSIITPSLTTIDVPKYEMGHTAALQLIRAVEQGLIAAEVAELPIRLVTRQSTDPQGDRGWDLFGW